MNELQAAILDTGNGSQRADTSEDVVAAVYARTSSASQRFGYSIGEQSRQCVKRCEMLAWEVRYVFQDEAVSGKDTDRPMFQRMLKLAKRGQFDVLIFWKLDRFSRSIMHAVELERRFREYDVALHSVTEQLDTTTPAGRFNFRNIANAAEFERDLNKQRTKMGHIARAIDHKWPNSTPPLGYERTESGKLQIQPQEASLVRWIFKTYLEERSMPAVADHLNHRARETDLSNEWSANAVSRILQNRLYAGVFSIGEVEEDAAEYQIVSKTQFEDVVTTRMRFRTRPPEGRGSMGRRRKEKRVKRILQSYSEYHSEQA